MLCQPVELQHPTGGRIRHIVYSHDSGSPTSASIFVCPRGGAPTEVLSFDLAAGRVEVDVDIPVERGWFVSVALYDDNNGVAQGSVQLIFDR